VEGLKKTPRGPAVNFVVTKTTDITDKIIPFFNKYSLEGAKYLEYQDFCKVANLIKDKAHFTEAGLNQIMEIKKAMNRWRNHDS
jgi:hypothetical protein